MSVFIIPKKNVFEAPVSFKLAIDRLKCNQFSRNRPNLDLSMGRLIVLKSIHFNFSTTSLSCFFVKSVPTPITSNTDYCMLLVGKAPPALR